MNPSSAKQQRFDALVIALRELAHDTGRDELEVVAQLTETLESTRHSAAPRHIEHATQTVRYETR